MTKLIRSFQWIGLAAMALVLLIPNASYADSRPDIVIAVNKLPRSLEPVESTGNVDVRAHYSTYDTLIRRDFLNPKKNQIPDLKPSLAESWKWIDKNTLELKLRKGVTFHSGDPVTADDVVFTFSRERMSGKNSVLPSGSRYFGHLKKVEKIDELTVRIITEEPDVMLDQRLATYAGWIVSKKQWMQYKDEGEKWAGQQNANMKKNKADTKKESKKKKKKKQVNLTWMHFALKNIRWNPIGTGPLKFVEWRKNQYIKYAANDGYFMGKPNFKTLTFKVVPEVATRIAGLASGEFDMIVDVPPDQFKVLDRYKDIEVRSVVLENTHMLVFNMLAPSLKDKRLRQALSLAIDRAQLRKALWNDRNYTPNG
ncbi:MAG: ABC transporter substrate-binding protein, partial [Rhodospirillales bacterium]